MWNWVELRPDELVWTERYKTGVYCTFQGQIGLSFKNAHPQLELELDRRYCTTLKEAPVYSKKIKCQITELYGYFVPLSLTSDQDEVMRSLLDLAEVAEELLALESVELTNDNTDFARYKLNRRYDKFVEKWGFVHNCTSYFDGCFADFRLQAFLSELEDDSGKKADIFFRRVSFPPTVPTGQLFTGEDIEGRINQAYSWSLGYLGRIDLAQIAEKSGVDEDQVWEHLHISGLAFRDVDEEFEEEEEEEEDEAEEEVRELEVREIEIRLYAANEDAGFKDMKVKALCGKYSAVVTQGGKCSVTHLKSKKSFVQFTDKARAIACMQELEERCVDLLSSDAPGPDHPQIKLAGEIVGKHKRGD